MTLGGCFRRWRFNGIWAREGLRRDVKSFFSLPVLNAIWTKTKLLQNQDFAAFIESSLKIDSKTSAFVAGFTDCTRRRRVKNELNR